MMMTLFVEHYGYYMDHELMAASAGFLCYGLIGSGF